MHTTRAFQFALIAGGIMLVVVVVAFLLSSKSLQRTFSVMETCDSDGVCEPKEENCADCQNLAGKLSVQDVQPKGGRGEKFLIALVAIGGITLLEVSLLARRK
ncbi:MAG: hypothetical protein V1735_03780 [Nanoarchaeota archaeon]